ncbi:hypothetical protein ACFW9F_23565 [Streptomyces sp. NPDC059506]|uniref:hypothetical protein n=1 Tax=Streptomyces sp. NPDC059506 TaxID=3347751 RepID=UPI0036ACA438
MSDVPKTEVRRALEMPDLGPYVDPRAVAELATLGLDVSRWAARHTGRYGKVGVRWVLARAGAGCRWGAVRLGQGSAVLGNLLCGWCSGAVGAKSWGMVERLGSTALGGYLVWEAVALRPLAGSVTLAGLWCTAALIAAVVSGKKPTNGPAEKPAGAPAGKAPDGGGEGEQQTPAEDPVVALVRELIGTDNGVHLQVLRPAMRERLPGLSQATDQDLNEVLRKRGFDPTRKFRAGGVPGRAGVHRKELPPLPSPGTASGALSAPLSASGDAGQSGSAESNGERRRGAGEGAERGFRAIHEPENGPTYHRIEHADRTEK